MSLKKVLICGDIKYAHAALTHLKTRANVTFHALTTKAAFLEQCHITKPTAIYRPLDTSSTIGKFDRSLLLALPTSVKFVAHNGAGYDQVDVEAAKERQIKVSNTPQIVNEATAVTALFLILGTLRRFQPQLASCHAGSWRTRDVGQDVKGKQLGIVGLGGIGSVLARYAEGVEMSVKYYARTKRDDPRYLDLESLLKTSDVVSLHLPLNSGTRHFMSTPQFNMMKAGSILINTARGPIVDEAALVEALKSGHLAGAGLDVYENEPKISQGLLDSDRVMMLPHIGTVTQETQKRLEELVLRNIVSALETGRLETPVPEHAGL